MQTLTAILIDDELSSLQNLQQKLIQFCPDVKIAATTQNPEAAVALIKQHRPNVIFLDIEMPKMSGFRLLEELGDTDSEIIFTTAYNHYAIDAIRISAFDYLTKPIAIADLQHAIAKLSRMQQHYTKEKIDVLKHSLDDSKSQEDKIVLPTFEGIEFIEVKNILRIESSSNYSKIYFTDGRQLTVTKLLKDFEDLLIPYRFFRIHNSHLINLNYIQKYLRGDGGQVIMQNGEIIDVSRRKKEDFLKIISG
ncbi:MAG: LytTR family DNA-binding domain-containing protein [Ferruginibacter sp.]